MQPFSQYPAELFQNLLVCFGKAVKDRAVNVQYANNFSIFMQGNHNLCIGSAVTGDMPGKKMHIVNPLYGVRLRRSAADPLSKGDADAGRLSLKGAEDKLLTFCQIEASPVNLFQRKVEQGGSVCQIGNDIPLVFYQAF